MVRNFRRSGQEPDLSLMSQGEDAYLVLRGVFHVSPPALGGLSIDGKLTLGSNPAQTFDQTVWGGPVGVLDSREQQIVFLYSAAPFVCRHDVLRVAFSA